MKLSKAFQAIAAMAALGFGANASALPVTFDLAGEPGSSVSVSTDCWLGSCGASVSLNPLLDSLSTTLSAGQHWEFDFFSINFYGLGIGSGTVSASLGFDSPTGAPNADGSGSGGFLNLGFLLTGGYLNWTSQPGSFSLADGTSYDVYFDDLAGVTLGRDVNVRARITLTREPVAVPEPGTLALFGLGLLGAGLAARKRRA